MTLTVNTIAPDDMVLLKTAGGQDAQISGADYAEFVTDHASAGGGLPAAPVITSAAGALPVTGTAPAGSTVRVKSGATVLELVAVAGDGTWSYQPPANTTATLTFHTLVTTPSATGPQVAVSTGLDWHAWAEDLLPRVQLANLTVKPAASGPMRVYFPVPISADPLNTVLNVPGYSNAQNGYINATGGQVSIAGILGKPDWRLGDTFDFQPDDDLIHYVMYDLPAGVAAHGRAFNAIVTTRGDTKSEPQTRSALISFDDGAAEQAVPATPYHRQRKRLVINSPASHRETMDAAQITDSGHTAAGGRCWSSQMGYGRVLKASQSAAIFVTDQLNGDGTPFLPDQDGARLPPTHIPEVNAAGRPVMRLKSWRNPKSVTSGPDTRFLLSAMMNGLHKPELSVRYGLMRWEDLVYPKAPLGWVTLFWTGGVRHHQNGTLERGWPPEVDAGELNGMDPSRPGRTSNTVHPGGFGSNDSPVSLGYMRTSAELGNPAGVDYYNEGVERIIEFRPGFITVYENRIEAMCWRWLWEADAIANGDRAYPLVTNEIDNAANSDPYCTYASGVGDMFVGTYSVYDAELPGYDVTHEDAGPAPYDLRSFAPAPLPPTLTGTPGNGKITWSWEDDRYGQPGATHRLYDGATLVHTFGAGESWEETGLANGQAVTRTLKAVAGNGKVGAASTAVTKTPVSPASVVVSDAFTRADAAQAAGAAGSTPVGNRPISGVAGIGNGQLTLPSDGFVTINTGVIGDIDVAVDMQSNGTVRLALYSADFQTNVDLYGDGHFQTSSGAYDGWWTPFAREEDGARVRIKRTGSLFEFFVGGTKMREFSSAFTVDMPIVLIGAQYSAGVADNLAVIGSVG